MLKEKEEKTLQKKQNFVSIDTLLPFNSSQLTPVKEIAVVGLSAGNIEKVDYTMI